jgi:chaperonin GroES
VGLKVAIMTKTKSLKERQAEWDAEYGPNSTKEHKTGVPVRPSDIQDALNEAEKKESASHKFKGEPGMRRIDSYIPIMLHNRILIKEDGVQETSAGGIFIPESAREKTFTGVVIAAGPGIMDFGVFIPTKVKEGDHVMYQQRAGDRVQVAGKEYLCVREPEILMIF